MEFWSRDGSLLGTKESLKDLIFEITGIPHRALCGAPLSGFPPTERLRWAATRQTKRKEDKAYSLLGIFDISMTSRYGEEDYAFVRLQRKIDKSWNPAHRPPVDSGLHKLPDEAEAAALREEHRRVLLDSLSFEQIDARHATIKEAQRSTCEWILAHPDYVAWNDKEKAARQQQILWVAGKPGAGKSTLMKFLLANAKRSKLEDEIILSFFFNARGDDLEKETRGMYRGLLIELFHEAPDLQYILDDAGSSNPSDGQSSLWTLETLQKLLSRAVRNLGRRRVKCFIDALDECDEKQVQDMIDFLEELGEDMLGNHGRVYFCLASRHYPTLEVRNGVRLILEDETGHADDLRRYIHRRLKAGKSRDVDSIYQQVQEKANGVFLWVALVVDILNEEFRRGRIFAVKRRLRKTPTGLSDLFKDLLRRDCVNMDDLLLCIQWILFAKRPLGREEFYFAMVTGLEHEHAIGWKPEPWNPGKPHQPTVEDMNRFVLNASKGLAELTRSRTAPTVQFVHESVRDFLIKDGGLCELWPELDRGLASQSHEKLKKCCLDYLAADLSSEVNLAKALPKAASPDMKQLRRSISDKYPFLQYASKEIFHHANEAACEIDQKAFLERFPTVRWIRIGNVYHLYDNRRHTAGSNIMYVLAGYGHSRLIAALPCDNVWRRYSATRYQFIPVAAYANGHPNTLQVLLGGSGATHMDAIVRDPGFGRASSVGTTQDLLVWAAMNDSWAFVEYLLCAHAGKGLFSTNARYKELSALSLAASADMTHIVQLLVKKGADLGPHANAQHEPYGTALHAAANTGSEKTVRLLLEMGADIHAKPFPHDTAFNVAVKGGWAQTALLLLQRDSKADKHDALCGASFRGHMEVAQMLLDMGTDANGPGCARSPLYYASKNGHKEIVELLIRAGADVNAVVSNDYNTALQAASASGHTEIVSLLLDKGANVNAEGGLRGDARYAASASGHEEIVSLLLDKGADVSASGLYGPTSMLLTSRVI